MILILVTSWALFWLEWALALPGTPGDGEEAGDVNSGNRTETGMANLHLETLPKGRPASRTVRTMARDSPAQT